MLLKASLWNTYLSFLSLCCSSHSIKSPFFPCHHFPLSSRSSHCLSRQVTWLRLSGFFCFTAGGAVIKVCQWETWVTLSHAFAFPQLPPQAPGPIPATPPPPPRLLQPTTSLSLSPLFLILIWLPFFSLWGFFFFRDAITRNSSKSCTRMHPCVHSIYTIYINTAG